MKKANCFKTGSQFLFVLLCALSAFQSAAQPSGGSHDYYDYYGKDGKTPREGLVNSVEAHHLYSGITWLMRGGNGLQYAKADFAFILNYFPNHPKALVLMIEVAFRLRQPDIAEERIKTALDLYPGSISPHIANGIFLHRSGKLPQALEAYRKGIALDTEDVCADCHYNIGLAYLDAKQPERANWHAQRAYAMKAELPGLRNRLTKQNAWNPDVDLTTMPGVEKNQQAKAASDSAPEGEAR